MSKIFILVASLMCIFTLAACSGRASVASDPTSICGLGLRPFDAACTEERFNVTKLQHCNQAGLSTRDFQTGRPHVDFERCTELAEANTCLADPFQDICETTPIFEDDIVNFRRGRIFLCGGGGGGVPCAFVNSCSDNGNPFDAECLKFDNFDENRRTRITLCTPEDVTEPSVIAGCGGLNLVGTQTITECIVVNPFHADCTHDAFDAARVVRVAACSEASPDANLLCGSAIGADIGTDDGMQTIANCITEPFHADCQNLAFNTSRAERLIACGGATDPSGINCDAVRERATSANWLRSFGTDRLDTEPDTGTNSRNQFLQGTEVVPIMRDDDGDEILDGDERGLNVGAVRTISGERPVAVFLNLRDAEYGEIEEDGRTRKLLLLTDAEGEPTGDVSDGVAFFLGSAARNANAYAGILAGTDLGAPPTDMVGTAEWNGEFRVIGTYIFNKDFELEIDFDTTTVTAFVQVRNEEDDPLHFSLNGTFNSNGVISGTVELGDYTGNARDATLPNNENRGSGMLTGLIGEEGAVGVFLKNNDDTGKSFNFAGGFVAAPTPDPEPTP